MLYNWFGTSFIPLAIPYSLSFIVLLIASFTDLKTREVPDWVNYGLIFSGVGLNLLFSAIYSTPSFIINSLVGLAIFFGIAYFMFYMGQWGGGDSKIIMGLGAIMGLDVGFKSPQFLAGFFINALMAGAVYGLLCSILLVFKNKEKFRKEFKKILSQNGIITTKKVLVILIFIYLIFILLLWFDVQYFNILLLIFRSTQNILFIFSSFLLLILVTFYLWIFVKAIEKSSMYKLVDPSKLTEGDWIVKDVYYNKEYITGPKDLGIEKKQIRRLIELHKKRKIGKVLIKEGIPFVPSFLIAFVITFLFGNPLMWLV